MIRKVITTGDNSKTLLITANNDTYHSIHGALTESEHVFIQHGLNYFRSQKSVRVFEMGFGTGLNCILTLEQAEIYKQQTEYHSIEKYPITSKEIQALEYHQLIKSEYQSYYKQIHKLDWNQPHQLTESFSLLKTRGDLHDHNFKDNFYDIIYFDAFGPKSQPDLWQIDILKKIFQSLKSGGIFITYCAQGQFKRDLKSAGFGVENLPGPPGKREITRGIKP